MDVELYVYDLSRVRKASEYKRHAQLLTLKPRVLPDSSPWALLASKSMPSIILRSLWEMSSISLAKGFSAKSRAQPTMEDPRRSSVWGGLTSHWMLSRST